MEIISTKDKWISFHLFYTDLTFLLKNGVSPFINELNQKKCINQYFFIRYWEKGPHIRLRLLVDDDKTAEVTHLLNSYFSNFFMINPSVRKNNSNDLLPNNSVQIIEYVPEVERYGGEFAIKIAEKHFQNSSEVVLKLIHDYDNWSITISQGKALQLYIVFFRAISLSNEDILKMITIMYNSHWKTIAQKIVGDKDIEEVFTTQYLKNEKIIKENIKSLNEIIDHNELINYPVLYDFFEKVKLIDEDLNDLNKRELITLKNPTTDSNAKKGIIYISYLHMLNNRLGLRNQDEAYISFLLKKGMNL